MPGLAQAHMRASPSPCCHVGGRRATIQHSHIVISRQRRGRGPFIECVLAVCMLCKCWRFKRKARRRFSETCEQALCIGFGLLHLDTYALYSAIRMYLQARRSRVMTRDQTDAVGCNRLHCVSATGPAQPLITSMHRGWLVWETSQCSAVPETTYRQLG